jgi:hypothetical protein
MNKQYEELKDKAFSVFRTLAKECEPFADAEMIVAAADTNVSLKRNKISRTIEIEWIERIEATIPALDTIIRFPSVAIEDVDEILPIELSRHITEKSIKHLATHTNLILNATDDEVTPSKILNVYHEETYLTYENRFINTLLARLCAFVDKRLQALSGGSGVEANYKFDYLTEFDHDLPDHDGKSSAKVNLHIELTSPLDKEMTEADIELSERYIEALNRLKRINMALISYRSSAFAQKLGRNYIRPPVIRTNAILKNKNLRECLNLWEYIENYDKVGYSFVADHTIDMPSPDYVGGMYSSVAWQYLAFYSGIVKDGEDNRVMTKKHISETFPEYDDVFDEDELQDYLVYDSEYKKTVPVSRLLGNRKKLSEDEKKIREAIDVALKADELINAEMLRREAEERRLAREARLAAEEAERQAEAERIRAEEEERARLAAEEAARLAEEDAQRIAEEEQKRAALEISEEIASIAASGESDETVAEMIESAIDRGVRMMSSDTKRSPFAFADEEGAEGQVLLPYTRAQYLALPRKKKKSVLMNVKKLVNYNATKRLLDALYDMKSDNPRILSRIEALEIRLEEESRFLPNSQLWQNAVQRVKN